MSMSESLDALRGYEDFLASRGADVVRRLRPGLNSQRIDDLCQRHNAVLPEDARALWMWHDGDAAGPWEDNGWTGQPGIVAWYSFPSLESTLTMLEKAYPNPGLQVDISLDDGTESQVPLRSIPPIAYYLGEPRMSLVCPDGETAIVFPGSGNDTYALESGDCWTIPEFVAMCEQCIESGIWRIYPDGQIRCDRQWQIEDYRQRAKKSKKKPSAKRGRSYLDKLTPEQRQGLLSGIADFIKAAQEYEAETDASAGGKADDTQEGDGHGVQ